jgi:hypothetical protein
MIEFFSKKIVAILVLFFIILIFCTDKTFAQSSSSILPKIRIDEVSTENKNNESIEGIVKISNLNSEIVPEYYLVIELNKQVETISTEKITKTIFGPYTLNSKETKNFPYKIDIPKKINSGNYFIKVIAKSFTGIDISTKMKALGELSGQDTFLETFWQDAKIIKDSKSEAALIGVNFSPSDIVTVSLKAKNPHNDLIIATPFIEIYSRTDMGKTEPIVTYSLDPVEFTPGFTKMFKIDLQKLELPESYYVLVKMKNVDQEIVSGYQEFRFVLVGNDSAKIISSKFNKETNKYILNLIGPADGSTTKNPTLKIVASDGKADFYKDELRLDYLGAKTKEVSFEITSKSSLPDSFIIKTEISSSSNKTLDTHTEDVVVRIQTTKVETGESKSSFNWFLLLFVVLFAIIVAMLIYLKKRTNLVMILILISSIFIFSPNVNAECSQVVRDDWETSCSGFEQPQVTEPEFNDSGANGRTFAVGTGPDITLTSGGISYSCTNNPPTANVNLQCTGNTVAVNEVPPDGNSRQITCKCTAPGPGGATGTASSNLSANCWTCQNSQSFSVSWTCQSGTQQPTNPNFPQYNNTPNPNIPINIPTTEPLLTSSPTINPLVTPSPTPSYIETAFPTNKPGLKAPGSVSVQSGQTWRCLRSSLDNADEHKLNLTGEGFLGGDYYVVGCLLTPTSSVCTTGSDQNDIKIGLGFGNYTRISQSNISPLPYLFAVEPNSLKIANGRLDVKVFSQSAETTTHFFYAVSLNTNLSNDEAKTLKYNTFNFNQDTSKCVSVRWDPTGYVFNAHNYRPISDISFTLLDKNMEIIVSPGISSIITPDKNGKFDFFIEPGIYYLKLNQNKNYSTAYKNELVRFEEKVGSVTHLNIPIYYK